MNVAAGGTGGFFPDGCTSKPDGNMASYTKPWSDTSATAYADFWNSVDKWYPTWYPFENNGESAALKVDYIRVYQNAQYYIDQYGTIILLVINACEHQSDSNKCQIER